MTFTETQRVPSRIPAWSMAVLLLLVSGQVSAQVPTPVQPAPAPTAFVDVAVVPMDQEQVLQHQTVLVRGDRIVAMGPAEKVSVPTDAVRIDGQGKYLIPGLADMHAHVPGLDRITGVLNSLEGDRLRLTRESAFTPADVTEAERMLFLYLANGITTVRIMHGSPEILALRGRAATGALLSPRIYAGTPMIPGPAPGFLGAMPLAAGINSPEEGIAIVETAKTLGYDFIKMYGVAGESLDSMVATARRLQIPIAGHVPGGEDGLQQAIQAGYTSIEHLSGFEKYLTLTDGQPIDTADLRATAMELKRAHVWNCPTQLLNATNLRFLTEETYGAWPEMRYITDSTLQRMRGADGADGRVTRSAQQSMAVYRQVVKFLHDAGAGLLLGTDAGVPGLLPGFSAHRELEELVQGGLTPYEALVTGTRNVAAYLNALDTTGTVAVGKRADLVLLTGNPLSDIRQTAHRAGVMLGGRWLPQAELEQKLAAIEGTLY